MFRRLVLDWSSKQQKLQAEDFLRRIRTADGSDLGMSVALVLQTANLYRETERWNLFEPAEVLATDIHAITKLSTTARQMQKERVFTAASALMVWVHSLRGIENFEVRPQAREIWKHLSRGFPYAKDGAAMIYQLNGMRCDLQHLGKVPTGLAAEVQS